MANHQQRSPTGSVLGPMLFNVFVNDLFYFVKTVLLTYYAYDNTLSYAKRNLQVVKLHLEREAEKCIWWFAINCMKANPDKFQAILLNCESGGSHCLHVNHHTNELCKKTGRQVNALKRLCHHISQDVRMPVFRAFILINFKYCPAIWHHCSVWNTKKIKKNPRMGSAVCHKRL